MNLVFRPPLNGELQFVRSTWLYATPSESKLAANADGEKWVSIQVWRQLNEKPAPKRALDLCASGWHRAHAALRDKVLADMRTLLVVAALESQPSEALGWICVEKAYPTAGQVWTVWWVHVAGEFRGKGVGTALIETIARMADDEDAVLVPGQMTDRARPWWARITGRSEVAA